MYIKENDAKLSIGYQWGQLTITEDTGERTVILSGNVSVTVETKPLSGRLSCKAIRPKAAAVVELLLCRKI